MSDFKKILAAYDQNVQKGISTSSLNGGSGSATITTRQDLDSVIVNLANRNTPLRDKITRTRGQGAAFTYNQKTNLYAAGDPSTNPRDMVYADGGLPEMRTTQYATTIVPYVSIGMAGSVTGLAEASGESLLDLYAAEVESTTRTVIQGEEWLNFWGSTSTMSPVTSLPQYAGLDQLITTNIVDATGSTISKYLFDQAANLIAQQGGQADTVYASFRTSANLNNLYNIYSQVIINGADRQALTYGNMVKNISTIAGVLDIVPDFFLNPGNMYPLANGSSSTPSGATTSTVFIVAHPFLEMRDLKPLGMEELGRVADYRKFYVNEYTAMKLAAEKFCAKIINVADAIVDTVVP